MSLHKSSYPGPRPPPRRVPNRRGDREGVVLEATISVPPFTTRQAMLDFIARATEGINAKTKDGTMIHIKI